LEHSIEAALWTTGAFFSAAGAGAAFAAGAGVAGVCANAEVTRNSDANAARATREDVVIMESPRVEEGRNVAPRC
jgi:hypothetical protein